MTSVPASLAAGPFVIGVTGLPCSGKSLAAGLIAGGEVAGIPGGILVKADDVGHAVLERPEVRGELQARFGGGIAAPTPAETRRLIAERVFTSPADLAWLESLLHPLVAREVSRAAAAAKAEKRSLIVEAALLTAAGLDSACDVVFVLQAAFAARLARCRGRGWTEAELLRRDARQRPLFAPERLALLGDKLILVDNDSAAGELAVSLAGTWAARRKPLEEDKI